MYGLQHGIYCKFRNYCELLLSHNYCDFLIMDKNMRLIIAISGKSVSCIIAILCIFLLIFFCDNFHIMLLA